MNLVFQDPLGHGSPFYLTTGSDARLCMWDPSNNNLCAETMLVQNRRNGQKKLHTGMSVGISYTGQVCCVGTESYGMICLLKLPLANGHNGTLDGLAAWPWMRKDMDSMDEGDLDQVLLTNSLS